ncbi:Tetratricopeptide repeat protein [Rosistilla carotiformis]|uniref:Tetratricopeptide repeat protein n=1 Tax=Rosistilla carotiformis TaxID=2528017 RepID=A0A518JVN4_9BACT|nr:tetratricopeptide repeat protein [Rosistilla carotiformis]QDV69604.1 Tetratricopeptide repeat protein [Rosistilla carotiformis]
MSTDDSGSTDFDTSVQRRQALEMSIRDAPADVAPYLELARIHRAIDKPAEAQKVLEKAVRVASDDPDVLWELEEAELARSLQRLKELKGLHNQHPTPDVTSDLERAQHEWAIRRAEVCRKRLLRDPSQTNLCIVMAEAMYEMGKFNEAIAALEPALEDPQECSKAFLVRGMCLQAINEPLAALTAFRGAALRRSLQPLPSVKLAALRHAADLASRLGLRATCKRYLRGILQLNPNDLVATQALARLEAKGAADFHEQETTDHVPSNR